MKILKRVDNFLNSITMYRLVLYTLAGISFYAIVAGLFGLVSFSAVELTLSLASFMIFCNGMNWILAKIFRAPTNVESASITALLLFLIFVPVVTLADLWTIALASLIAMASKYVLAIRKKHLFNPAAIAAFVLMIAGNGNAIWWVGTPAMFPIVTILGLLVVRKIRRAYMFWACVGMAFLMVTIFNVLENKNLLYAWEVMFLSWPIMFFATYMLTEPLTTPPTRKLQIMYGALVGYLMSSRLNLRSIYVTPEAALVIGNIFSYIVSPKQKLILHLKEKKEVAKETYDFVFETPEKLHFEPGQYIECTLPHERADERGNRRYFTLASSPTEQDIRLGVKVAPLRSSSFKSALMKMRLGETIVVSQLAGDFVLERDKQKKLVFIAGGIGVTPFRSMVKYLIDKREKRDIVLFYVAMSPDAFAYREIFDEASDVVGLKTVYILSGAKEIPPEWKGPTGFLDKEMIEKEVSEYTERIYYLSGPQAMVSAYKVMLEKAGVPSAQIRTDYFPGF
jgi:ferredoxin-NADP reductase/Na+-translocating ferredoxin:NAD+ oxidoreductase RnfD subunit